MYEYVVLEDRAETAWQHNNLVIQGWAQWMLIPWNDKVGKVCIMRRPKDEPLENDHFREKWFHTRHCLCDECAKKKRDEPRKFTFAELREAMKDKWLKEETTIRSQELQKRNEELQAAIDRVVKASKMGRNAPTKTYDAVCIWLHPLMKKEEK